MDNSPLMFRSAGLLLLIVAAVGGALHLFDFGAAADAEGPTPAALAGDALAMQASAGGAPGLAAGGTAAACRVEQPPRPLPADVHESSGAAGSRARPEVVWTHNDSGDPVVYAIGAGGELLGRTMVVGAAVRDWEDIAIGPCPGGDCLYVADIGDNDASRPAVVIYRFPEPGPGDARSGRVEAFHARYPDGPHDAEAMFVLPSGEMYLVTKGETGPVTLYRFPPDAQPGSMVELQRVRDLAQGQVARGERITGADASRDGRWIAVRSLRALWIYPAASFLGSGENHGQEIELGFLREPQGEGVAFGPGNTLVLTSEGGKREIPATLARLACDLP